MSHIIAAELNHKTYPSGTSQVFIKKHIQEQATFIGIKEKNYINKEVPLVVNQNIFKSKIL